MTQIMSRLVAILLAVLLVYTPTFQPIAQAETSREAPMPMSVDTAHLRRSILHKEGGWLAYPRRHNPRRGVRDDLLSVP